MLHHDYTHNYIQKYNINDAVKVIVMLLAIDDLQPFMIILAQESNPYKLCKEHQIATRIIQKLK